jgi:hypothetical protein
VTGPDVWDPPKVVARMLSARARAKFLPRGQRTWTTTPAPGWEPNPTLDAKAEATESLAEASHG